MTPSAIYRTEAGEAEIKRRYLDLLDRWPVPHERVRVATGQGETFVVVSGPPDAPPVVLLHGSGANTTMWMGDVTAWSRHFRVCAVDLIGEPGLSAPSRPPLGTDAHARWLDEVLDALGVDRAAVVGASLGGLLAADYATRRPERVDRLVLLCPGGIGRQKVGVLVKAVLLRPFGDRGLRRGVRSIAGIGADAPFLDQVVLHFTHFRPRLERLPLLTDEVLRRLAMPTLVIVGERDAMLDSAGTARRVRRAVPHATVVVLPGVGHSITGQTEEVLGFLRA
ncbi:alpha/beta fold hydrolase [Saccharothrix syringae]|uniref:Alpha/beta fold hydrolase n=1 Tax=Saccharothrix syringae TaxID=103733 RepID=A0A5Q0H6P0_SACSY|nr:alpha/beta fold hydrolase [Saccharothrix syringae]QFZ21575.1 alpha/beta fold hydrolase [Saccharothrix syringae]